MKKQNKKKITIKDMAIIALVTSVICVIAPFSIPLPISPIPITLAVFVLFLDGIILGSVRGIISTLVYLFLGMAGIPVFTGFVGGIQKFVSPTGGYLIGYVFLVFFTGLFTEKCKGRLIMYFVGGIIGLTACYAFGTIWFIVQYKTGVMETLTLCVFPYIPFDILKLIFAIIVGSKIRKILLKQNMI